MRYKPRLDSNQKEVVEVLRKAGFRVLSLAALGGGAPDLLVAHNHKMVLVEVKDGKKKPSARKLTLAQEDFHKEWYKNVVTILNPEDAMTTIDSHFSPL